MQRLHTDFRFGCDLADLQRLRWRHSVTDFFSSLVTKIISSTSPCRPWCASKLRLQPVLTSPYSSIYRLPFSPACRTAYRSVLLLFAAARLHFFARQSARHLGRSRERASNYETCHCQCD